MSSQIVDPCIYCLARHLCAFNRLRADERRALQSIARTASFDRGRLFVRQGDDATRVYVVLTGVVRLALVTPSGKNAIVKVLGPGGMVGLIEALSEREHLMSAETVEVSRLEVLERGDLLDFLSRHPETAIELLRWVSREYHETLGEWFDTMSKSSLTSRLWHNLRTIGETCGVETADGVELSPHLTVQDLSHGLGCSRQWTSKLLAELEGEGRIERRGRRIILPASVLEAIGSAGGN